VTARALVTQQGDFLCTARQPVAIGGAAPSAQTISDVVEIVVMLGDPECAEQILDFYCDIASTDRWARPGALTELRYRALIAAVAGDCREALDRLESGLAQGEIDAGSPDVGRTLLVRGTLRTLFGQVAEARADLDRAADIFSSHGLLGWCDAALRALISTSHGERPARAPRSAEAMAALLTGGYWGPGEITAGLRRSLAEVEGVLSTLAQAPRMTPRSPASRSAGMQTA
jgi:hypothetical protein